MQANNETIKLIRRSKIFTAIYHDRSYFFNISKKSMKKFWN